MRLNIVLAFTACLYFPCLEAQDHPMHMDDTTRHPGAMKGMDMEGMDMGDRKMGDRKMDMPMNHSLSLNLPMNRDGSGTRVAAGIPCCSRPANPGRASRWWTGNTRMIFFRNCP